MNISEYADAINKDIIIIYYANQDGRFCVQLEDCEIMLDGMLCSTFGNGFNIPDAIENYLEEICGNKVAFNSCSQDRQEFIVPKGLTVE